MAMKIARSVGPSRFRSLFSTVSTNSPYKRPMADPSTNLLVSNLNARTTDDGLREAFAKFGEVVHARVVRDCASGWSKRFGFVQYSTLEGAAAGVEGMDGGVYLDCFKLSKSVAATIFHVNFGHL
ncbi:glycine-rich RNA-binding protein 3, mitochondrial [Tanacetum coccineum]